jgi:uncharacterized protein (TIGR02231 family)
MVNYRFLFLLFAFSLFISGLAYAEEFKTESDLISATVYSNRATLVRRVELDVPKGDHTLIINKLPTDLITDSLRAEGAAKQPIILGALSHKVVIENELTVPRERELNTQLEQLRVSAKLLYAEKTALSERRTFLKNLGNQAKDKTNDEISDINLKPDQWSQAAQTIHEETEKILKENVLLEVKLNDINKKITALEQEIYMLGTGHKSFIEVKIPLEVSNKTKITLDLSYQIPNASWKPLYDARLSTKDNEIELLQYGAVWQQTGEDWSDISLTLSTAQPHRGASLPPLQQKWVNIYQSSPRRAKANRAPAVSSPGFVYEERAREENEKLVEQAIMEGSSAMPRPISTPSESLKKLSFKAAKIDTGGFVSEYVIPGPSTVMSDGTESKLFIGAFDIDSELEVHIKPELSTNAMLVSNITLKGETPILPGKVSLFRDNAFVGHVNMPLLRPDESQYLGFGIDDQISVSKHDQKDQTGESGLLGKEKTLEKHFLTEVINLHEDPVKIMMLKMIPISQDEKIKISVLNDKTTPGYEMDGDNIKGLMRWKRTLKPKEKYDVRLGWEIKWPADHYLSGM